MGAGYQQHADAIFGVAADALIAPPIPAPQVLWPWETPVDTTVLVDGPPVWQGALAQHLAPQTSATDDDEALNAMSRAHPPPDALVTDVRMPGTNGVELAKKLKERDAAVPVIVITGHADVPLAIQAMKAGAADFIEKPFDDEAILAAIRKALNESTEDEQKQNERREVLDRLALLSTREREVVDGLVDGKANKVIAFDHDISPRTVEVYRANAMMKMQAKTLSDLVRMVTIARLG